MHKVYAKALEHTQKNVHANFEIPLISKILERYFAEIFYSCLRIIAGKNGILLISVQKFPETSYTASNLFHMFKQSTKFYTILVHILKTRDV